MQTLLDTSSNRDCGLSVCLEETLPERLFPLQLVSGLNRVTKSLTVLVFTKAALLLGNKKSDQHPLGFCDGAAVLGAALAVDQVGWGVELLRR